MKHTIAFVQPNFQQGPKEFNAYYLPYSAGVVWSYSLADPAISERFEEAFKLAEGHAKYKLPEVHLKFALHLEDENRFKEAEEEFIKANKPQEAINMYEHKGDWASALNVAR